MLSYAVGHAGPGGRAHGGREQATSGLVQEGLSSRAWGCWRARWAPSSSRLLGGLLYEVSPSDPAAYVAVATGLGGVALLASWLPARRAMRVDPVVALRMD